MGHPCLLWHVHLCHPCSVSSQCSKFWASLWNLKPTISTSHHISIHDSLSCACPYHLKSLISDSLSYSPNFTPTELISVVKSRNVEFILNMPPFHTSDHLGQIIVVNLFCLYNASQLNTFHSFYCYHRSRHLFPFP